MSERTVVVASSVGLHARPASLFSQAAAKTGVAVTLTSAAGKSVNAASILGVLSLGIGGARTLACGQVFERQAQRFRPFFLRRRGHDGWQ